MTPALAESARVGGSTFSLLPIGARFVFNRDDASRADCVMIKTSANGYRFAVGGRVWRSGARSTVFTVKP